MTDHDDAVARIEGRPTLRDRVEALEAKLEKLLGITPSPTEEAPPSQDNSANG